VSLDIVGINNGTLDGGSSAPGLFVYKGGVSIDDLLIRKAKAQGVPPGPPGGRWKTARTGLPRRH
jgi:hypothetical protein